MENIDEYKLITLADGERMVLSKSSFAVTLERQAEIEDFAVLRPQWFEMYLVTRVDRGIEAYVVCL